MVSVPSSLGGVMQDKALRGIVDLEQVSVPSSLGGVMQAGVSRIEHQIRHVSVPSSLGGVMQEQKTVGLLARVAGFQCPLLWAG